MIDRHRNRLVVCEYLANQLLTELEPQDTVSEELAKALDAWLIHQRHEASDVQGE